MTAADAESLQITTAAEWYAEVPAVVAAITLCKPDSRQYESLDTWPEHGVGLHYNNAYVAHLTVY